MKKRILLLITLFIFGIGVSFGQTYTENFDTSGNWSGSSGYSAKQYTLPVPQYSDKFSTNEAFRDNTNTISGYAWRLKDSGNTYFRYECVGTVTEFKVQAARWDNSPKPNVTVRYSLDSGVSYTTVSTFDGDIFSVDKTYQQLTYTLGSPITNTPGNKIYIEFLTTTGERMLYDDFEVTFSTSTDTTLSLTNTSSTVSEDGTSINVCVSITNADASNDTTVDLVFDAISTASNDGSDFTLATFPHTLTFPAGSSADQCLTITLTDDAIIESDETIVVNLQNALGGNNATLGTDIQHTVTITNDDSNEMSIEGQATEIANNDTTPDVADDTEFGTVNTTSGTLVHTFTIKNTGTADLTLTDASPYISISGHTADFTLTAIPTTPISPAGNTTFEITFDPTVDGLREATISIANNDSDENPYTFNIQGTGNTVIADCSELFFSMYAEGSGHNKYLEIYNPSGADINLSNYSIVRYTNGSSTASTPLTLSGTITSKDVFIVERSAETLGVNADLSTTNAVMEFNGNDAIALQKLGVNVDVIGQIGFDPGSSWTTNGVSTKDMTLIRKVTIQKGDDDGTDVFTPDTEWFALPKDQVDYFGFHDSQCSGTSCTSTTVWSGSSWSNGDPTTTSIVIFDGDFNIGTTDVNSCETYVSSTATLTVEASHFLNVYEDISNFGTIIVENTGSLVQVNDDATVTGSGIFSAEIKTTSMPDARYTYFSSPSQTETMAVFSSWDEASRNFTFDGSIQDWAAVAPGDTMTPGKGYIVRPEIGASYPAQFTTYFTGAFNNGVITHPLTFNSGGTDDDNELVGNPYPSAIGTASLLAANTDANAFYFWSHSAGGDWSAETYLTWNTSGTSNGAPATIASGQGFFVTATANGTLTFNNALRQTGNNTTFLRPTTSNLDKLWLSIEANAEVGAKILIAFNPICSDGFDAQYDAISFNGTNKLDFYSFGTGLNTNNLVIQTRGELNNNDTVIPLGFSFNSTDATITNLTISIDHFENLTNENIYLRDNLLNTLHNLKVSEYNFTLSEAGINDTRFELVFSRGALSVNDNLISSDDLFISSIDATNFKVVMRNNLVITNFKAFDILGKLIIDINPNQSSFNVNTDIKEGTILVTKSTLENGQVVSKKFIKL